MVGARLDALDQLEYEDLVLRKMLAALDDPSHERGVHGRTIKLFVERLAVREAAREYTGEALVRVPELAGLGVRLRASVPLDRRDLDCLDDLTRGLTPTNVNQGQDVDAAIAEMAPRLLAEIEDDSRDVISVVKDCLDPMRRSKVLPKATFVLRHCPLHPGPHPRRWYERIGPWVWAHAVYDYLRSLPVAGFKPRVEVVIPGEGVVHPERALGRRA